MAYTMGYITAPLTGLQKFLSFLQVIRSQIQI